MNNGMPTIVDLKLVLPELVWCGFAVFIMLLQPFLKTESGEFYRRVGRALGGSGDPAGTADTLFRAVFPSG